MTRLTLPSKKNFLFLVFLFISLSGWAQEISGIPNHIEKTTYTYLTRNDTLHLRMDVYRIKSATDSIQPCMFFVFGGGFTRGERDNAFYNPYYTALAENGITVIAIDYRLGMKNRKGFSIFNTEPMDNAIQMGVEDLFEATNFVIRQAEQFNIDTEMMMISGSSAGAIICLHADYIKRNNFQGSEILPPDFQYKGVLSFAGAILSHKGTPDYITPPAPTLFFHGDKDKLVVYNKLRFFRLGLFGSASIAKRFNKREFSYCFYTVKDMSHSIATLPLQNYTDQILFFIEEYIYRQKPWQMNILLKDNSLKPDKTTTIKQMYN